MARSKRNKVSPSTDSSELIKGIQEFGKAKLGMKDLIKYLSGGELTQKKAINAYCYYCLGYGEFDDCDTSTCPLFPFSTYGKKYLQSKQKHLSDDE